MMRKSSKNNTLLSSLGFSLVELMVTLGIAGAGAVGFMQLQKSQMSGQKKTEAKHDVSVAANTVGSILLNEENCRATFTGLNFNTTSPVSFGQIRAVDPSGSSRVVMSSSLADGAPYIVNNVEVLRYEFLLQAPLIASSSTDRYGSFNVSVVYRNNSGLVNDNRQLRQEIPYEIKVQTDVAGNFVECFNSIDDTETLALEKACLSIGGDYITETDLCELQSPIANPDVDSMLLGAAHEDQSRLLNWQNFRDQVFDAHMTSSFLNKRELQTLPNTQIDATMQNELKMSPGVTTKVAVVSDNRDAINKAYLDSLLLSQTCGSGEVGLFTDDQIICQNLLCPNAAGGIPQYLVGINSDGTKICNPIVAENASPCSAGGRLSVNASGSLQFECCTPTCPGAENYCAGTLFGSGNGCGTCTGTKPVQDATWGAWIDTGETRTNGTCVAGSIPVQKRQTRACSSGNECGASSCSGNDEQWVAAGTQSCATPTLDEYRWCANESMCTCMNLTTMQYPVSIQLCQDSPLAGSCELLDCDTGLPPVKPPVTFSGKKYTCQASGNWSQNFPSESCSSKSHTCDYVCTGGGFICLQAVEGTESCCNGIPTAPCGGGDLGPMPTTTSTGGGGCFIAGSQVTSQDRSLVNIEDIKVGDKLLTTDHKVNTVKELIRIDYKGPIYGINGSDYFFTPNHPLKTLDGWKSLRPDLTKKEIPDLKVEMLKLGDILVKENGLEVIMSLDSKYTEETVYNFELDGDHEFIVNDIGVHNKLAPPDDPLCPPPGPGQPYGCVDLNP